MNLQGSRTKVLLVDDSAPVALALARHLSRAGFIAETYSDARSALSRIALGDIRVVVSDISMPEMSGIELLKQIRERDQDLPVVLITASPDIESATGAVDFGAFRYLTKPIEHEALISTVRQAAKLHELAIARRDALAEQSAQQSRSVDRESLEVCLRRAVDALWMAYQPIVRAVDGSTFGYEALLRSDEPALPHPGAILDAATRLNALPALGRAVRARVASDMLGADPAWRFFVNLHPSDLSDLEEQGSACPLDISASRVVLEVTERAAIETVNDVKRKIARLRQRGYAVAVDDLGAGYAGLSSFVHLEPEFVKLDMALVRDAHKSSVKARLIRSIASVCRDLGMLVVAEGVETVEERDALIEYGCDLLQGFYLGKPARGFVPPRW
ncbi:MAG: EAL domain-containing response regulator [Polyangiaceae bacterium]|nr:EAL domain-containing response regulator [Polyangiaceae bacterium]